MSDRPGRAWEIQPGGEIRANKSKLMKGDESKSPFISFYFFFRIGTFQWVTGDLNKKIPLKRQLASKVVEPNLSNAFRRSISLPV